MFTADALSILPQFVEILLEPQIFSNCIIIVDLLINWFILPTAFLVAKEFLTRWDEIATPRGLNYRMW